ncbi:MAG TPA: hypothetical protein VKZ54_01530 [Membranihabitans sp.]|nr:hypothetical protein [Membranihabitans sp.]
MKKRLDIQSLLEDSQKTDLVRFLKSCFAKNTSLADDFLIHFASTFQLDESEFRLITDRIARMFPANVSNLTHRQANLIRDHLNDLLEQTRDCQSREDYRQAFLIVSHVALLLDQYIEQIPDKFQFLKIQNRCFQLLDNIYKESPAPSLKAKMRLFLQEIITQGKAIPLDDKLNPYIILLDWVRDSGRTMGRSLLKTLKQKSSQFPDYQKLWISQKVQILVELGMDKELLELLSEGGNDTEVYEALHRYIDDQDLQEGLLSNLRLQYFNQDKRVVQYRIYQIVRDQSAEIPWLMEVGVKEYFQSGDISILEDLLLRKNIDESDLLAFLENYIHQNPETELFHLYSAFKYMRQYDLLRDYLLKEKDVFEILPFLEIVYPQNKEAIENKMAELIESYLRTHFGRPAINQINGILDEINRLGHYDLISYLLQRIRQQFGHRKHFQKLMKELVQ